MGALPHRQVPQGHLQVLLGEGVVGDVQLPQRAAPLLGQQVEPLLGGHRRRAVEVQAPEQTLQVWSRVGRGEEG